MEQPKLGHLPTPEEVEMTPRQFKAYKRILSIIKENFRLGVIAVAVMGKNGNPRVATGTFSTTKKGAVALLEHAIRQIENGNQPQENHDDTRPN